MAFGTLYTTADNSRSIAIKALAKANNLELDTVLVDLTNPSIEHLKVNPLGKIPTFVAQDGFVVSECIALAIYFASQDDKTTLLGKTKQDYASILMWMSYFNFDLLASLGGWFRPLAGKAPYNKKAVADSSKATFKAVKVVEQYLERHTFLVGERITLADTFCASLLSRGFQSFFDKQWRLDHPNVTRWYDTVTNQPMYLAVVSKTEYLETPALTNVPPKKPYVPKSTAA